MSNSRSYIPAEGSGMTDLETHASFALRNNNIQVTASLCASVSHTIKRR